MAKPFDVNLTSQLCLNAIWPPYFNQEVSIIYILLHHGTLFYVHILVS